MAAGIAIVGVAPPVEVTGLVADTEVTVPEPLLLKVVQSVLVKAPVVEPLAAAKLNCCVESERPLAVKRVIAA